MAIFSKKKDFFSLIYLFFINICFPFWLFFLKRKTFSLYSTCFSSTNAFLLAFFSKRKDFFSLLYLFFINKCFPFSHFTKNGEKAFTNLFSAAKKKVKNQEINHDDLSSKGCAKLLKKKYSKTIFKDFAKWLNNNPQFISEY
ncbi:hypothetical protein [Eubacterium uniforme]|uniref:hypothetical protein n=1 Tax=Eubacterium uniforme TaxID=39495 RepID=UPI001179D454|nr:hypothetical protein [Eubacterium uniforme]